jgi:hypothetical protein
VLLNNDEDSLGEHYSELMDAVNDPFYFAHETGTAGQPSNMYPPHKPPTGANIPPAESREVEKDVPEQEKVQEIPGYHEPALQPPRVDDEDEYSFSDDGSIYGNVDIKVEESNGKIDDSKTRIDENTKLQVKARDYKEYEEYIPRTL